MRKILFASIALFFIMPCFSQQIKDPAKLESYKNFKSKAKRQTITGATLICLGLVSTGISTGSAFSHPSNMPSATAIGFYGGFVLDAVGIGFLLSSDHNNKKAKALKTAFKMENAPSLAKGAFITTYYPSVSIQFKF